MYLLFCLGCSEIVAQDISLTSKLTEMIASGVHFTKDLVGMLPCCIFFTIIVTDHLSIIIITDHVYFHPSIIIIIIIVKGAPPCSKTPLAITEQIQALATQYNLEFKVLGLVISRLHPISIIEIMLLLINQCQLCFYCVAELID